MLRETLESGKPVVGRVVWILDAEGERVPLSVSTAVLQDETGRVSGGAETFRDLSELEALRHGADPLEGFVTRSAAMDEVLELARAVADTPSTVLIQGETGSGKEVLARAIHRLSSRREEPFVVINCAALPDTLLESELFGYRRGAFTGADRDKPGRFALAGRGTLFLDEIGEVSPALQVRLLRVLQERVYEPLGGTASLRSEARIIAATHRNLEALVEAGSFRQDLYYRINVMTLHLPPLRERREDIPLLADQFLERINRERQRTIPGFTPEVYGLLMGHDWPGNVRELANVVERAAILCGEEPVGIGHLLEAALARNGGNRGATARELGMHRTTLYRKLKAHGIS